MLFCNNKTQSSTRTKFFSSLSLLYINLLFRLTRVKVGVSWKRIICVYIRFCSFATVLVFEFWFMNLTTLYCFSFSCYIYIGVENNSYIIYYYYYSLYFFFLMTRVKKKKSVVCSKKKKSPRSRVQNINRHVRGWVVWLRS